MEHLTQLLLFVQVLDWLPTLLSAAGYDVSKLPADLSGVDQWKALSARQHSVRTLNSDHRASL